MKLTNVFAIVFLSFFWLSCTKDKEELLIGPSVTLIEMEGEGGEADVSFTGEGWTIEGVINKNGKQYIHGNSYSSNGELLRKNNTLTLEGLGRMETFWPDKGFSIARTTHSSLKIALKENSTGEDFSFIIRLQSGEKLKEITVVQKKSHGYQFDTIEYRLKEDDGDSLFISRGSTYRFDIQSSQEFSFSPFNGINVNKQSYFESKEDNAFVWLKDTPATVKIPSGIYNNDLYYNGEKSLYTNVAQISPHGFEGNRVTVVVLTGKSEFFTEIQYRRRKVSYIQILTNNRTKEKKTVEGKWIEISPTGKYTVKMVK